MVGGNKSLFKSKKNTKFNGKRNAYWTCRSGQMSKLANQIIVGVTIGAVAEAIHLCKKMAQIQINLLKLLKGFEI